MVPKGSPRERSFKLVLSEDEHNWLMFLAHEQGQPAAVWLRQLIRQQWKSVEDAKTKRELEKFLAET